MRWRGYLKKFVDSKVNVGRSELKNSYKEDLAQCKVSSIQNGC